MYRCQKCMSWGLPQVVCVMHLVIAVVRKGLGLRTVRAHVPNQPHWLRPHRITAPCL